MTGFCEVMVTPSEGSRSTEINGGSASDCTGVVWRGTVIPKNAQEATFEAQIAEGFFFSPSKYVMSRAVCFIILSLVFLLNMTVRMRQRVRPSGDCT